MSWSASAWRAGASARVVSPSGLTFGDIIDLDQGLQRGENIFEGDFLQVQGAHRGPDVVPELMRPLVGAILWRSGLRWMPGYCPHLIDCEFFSDTRENNSVVQCAFSKHTQYSAMTSSGVRRTKYESRVR
jgi:hypothetical protein